MGEVPEVQLNIKGQENQEAKSTEETNKLNVSGKRKYMKWFTVALYIFLMLSSQSIAVLLGRLYFDKGGQSKWVATLVQLVAFPILLPLYFFLRPKTFTSDHPKPKPSSRLVLALVYLSIGLLLALECFLYAVGLMYLPVSTYSLICASQLAFNALFSFFFNSQKFTPYIINSLVLLTASSVLLVFQSSSEGLTNVSRGQYIAGFICTVAASAGYSLVLSFTQLAFTKLFKSVTFKTVVDMVVYPCLVATSAILLGFFVSGDWKKVKQEMKDFELGKVSYVMTLLWTAISWQVFGIGCVGLIAEVSSLFSNAISAVGLPIVPILAVIFFHDSMSGVKGIAMFLAVWGFVSYVYQQYVDDHQSKVQKTEADAVSESSGPPTTRI